MHYPIATNDKIKTTMIYNPGVNKKSDIPNHFIIDVL